MLDASLAGDNPFSCVLKYPELCYESVSSHVVLMASQGSVCLSHGRERRTRDNPTTRHKGQENHSCAPVSAHTHTLSRLPRHLLCQINLDVSQVHNSIYTLLGQVKERGLCGRISPLVCGLHGFLLLICSSLNYGVMNGEGLDHFSVCSWLRFV